MKFNRDWLEKRWVAYTIATCSAVVLYMILSNLGNIFYGLKVIYRIVSPLVIGLITAYIISPLVSLIRNNLLKGIKKEHLKSKLAVAFALIIIVLVIALLMFALIPQLFFSVKTLINNMDTYISSLQLLLHNVSVAASERNIDISGITGIGDNILKTLSKIFPENMDRIVATSVNISKAIFDMVIGLFLAIYFLADKERLQGSLSRLLKRIIKEKKYAAFASFWARCNSILIRYIAFDIIDGIIVGVANFFFMSIMNMPYAVLVSVVVGITNLAPTFGPMAGFIIGGFILVLVNPWDALWFLVFTVVLQTIDGYILKPKLFGGTLGIPGVWILISIIVGSRMFGVAGILLAIPFAAIVDFIYHDLIFPNKDKIADKAEKVK